MRLSFRRAGMLGVVSVVLSVGVPAMVGAGATASRPPAGRATDPIPPRPHTTAAAAAPATLAVSPWQALTNAPPFCPGAMLLLTDGTVIVQDQCGGSNWWKLTPDVNGSYVNGTWSQIASLPAGYAPTYFGSAVLPDGRVIIEGGEYNGGTDPVWTNLGAIYNPLTNVWTAVTPPADQANIGDAATTVLTNGKLLLSGCCSFTQDVLNPATLTWTTTGTSKADGNNEEALSLLPNGQVLSVDANNGQNTELYTRSTGAWSSAGSTPAALANGGELGPQLLRPNGTVFAAGATGANAVYKVSTGVWSAGPSFPVIGGQQYDSADGPSAILPNGSVLIAASPGEYQTPTHFFVFNGTALKKVADPPNAANTSSFYGFMMVLPTGQVLYNDRSAFFGVYTATASAPTSYQPQVTSVPTALTRGSTYTVSGRQLCGLTQGSGYGDDYQSATNYPLVRITNTATGNVVYAATSAITGVSVKRNAPSSAKFKVPAGTQTGASTLAVVANGIASIPVSVTIS